MARQIRESEDNHGNETSTGSCRIQNDQEHKAELRLTGIVANPWSMVMTGVIDIPFAGLVIL